MSHQERTPAPATKTTAKDAIQYPQQHINNQHNTNHRPANSATPATATASARPNRAGNENTTETIYTQEATLRNHQSIPAHYPDNRTKAGLSSTTNTRIPKEHDCYENTPVLNPPVSVRPNAQAKLRPPTYSPHLLRIHDTSAKANAIPNTEIRPTKQDKHYENTPDYSTTTRQYPSLFSKI
jgi:hypothetical protein